MRDEVNTVGLVSLIVLTDNSRSGLAFTMMDSEAPD